MLKIKVSVFVNFEVGRLKKKKMKKKMMMGNNSKQRCGSIPYVIISVYLRVLYSRETLVELVMCLKGF